MPYDYPCKNCGEDGWVTMAGRWKKAGDKREAVGEVWYLCRKCFLKGVRYATATNENIGKRQRT